MGCMGLQTPLTPHSIVSVVSPPGHGHLDARSVALARRWPPGGAPHSRRGRRSPSWSCSPHGTTPVARTLPRHGMTLAHAPLSLDPIQPCWCVLIHSVCCPVLAAHRVQVTALARPSRGAGPHCLTFSRGDVPQLSAAMPPDASDEVSEHTSPRQVATPQV